jgi:hypothetical protein
VTEENVQLPGDSPLRSARRRRARALGTFVLIVALQSVAATSNADVVEVANGDRFNGDVSRMERGQLAFSTPSAGTISISWSDVVRLTSSLNLDVELSSGERLTGTLSSPAAGQLVVTAASGPSRSIDMASIVGITLVGLTFVERTAGSIDFGISFTQASKATQYTLDAEARNRTLRYENEAVISSWLSRRSDAETLARNRFEVNSRRLLPDRWFAFAVFEAQQDDQLELDSRILAGGGVGRRLARSNDMFLSVEGGLDYSAERYRGTDGVDHAAEIFAGVDWDWFGGGATEAATTATTYFSLARARARVELEARLQRDIAWSLHWSVNVFESFDSDPPADKRRSDLGLALALGWSF